MILYILTPRYRRIYNKYLLNYFMYLTIYSYLRYEIFDIFCYMLLYFYVLQVPFGRNRRVQLTGLIPGQTYTVIIETKNEVITSGPSTRKFTSSK